MNRLVQSLILACCVYAPSITLAQDSFPIRRCTPYERGDRFRSDVSLIKVTKGTATAGGATQPVTEKQLLQCSAVVTIDTVDTDGYPLVWLAKIVRFVGPDENGTNGPLLRPGTDVLFDRVEGTLSVSMANGASLEPAATQIEQLLNLAARADDAPFEPPGEVSVGQSWNADVATMREALIESGPPQLRLYPEVFSIAGGGKLLSVKKYRDANCLDIQFTAETRITEDLENPDQFITKADQKIEERVLVPADYSTDFLDRRKVVTEALVTEGKRGNPSLDITQTSTLTEKRTYLEFGGGGVRPWKAPEGQSSWSNGLVFHLDFELNSVIGDGKSAQIRPSGALSDPIKFSASGVKPGKVGMAASFDGVDDHIVDNGIAEVFRSGLDAVTVACWIKTPPKKVQFVFDVGFYGDTSASLVIADKTGKFHLGPKTGGVSLDFPLTATEWTHVAVTWDGSLQRVYLNGKLKVESPTKKRGSLDKNSISESPFYIGTQAKESSRGSRYFKGEIDEFSMWRRALDPTEIATLHQMGNDGESILDVASGPR